MRHAWIFVLTFQANYSNKSIEIIHWMEMVFSTHYTVCNVTSIWYGYTNPLVPALLLYVFAIAKTHAHHPKVKEIPMFLFLPRSVHKLYISWRKLASSGMRWDVWCFLFLNIEILISKDNDGNNKTDLVT